MLWKYRPLAVTEVPFSEYPMGEPITSAAEASLSPAFISTTLSASGWTVTEEPTPAIMA